MAVWWGLVEHAAAAFHGRHGDRSTRRRISATGPATHRSSESAR
jgi:hypothetical protein